jgi:CRP/FNR family transcriptional regulator, cyclic AMP receptor protein
MTVRGWWWWMASIGAVAEGLRRFPASAAGLLLDVDPDLGGGVGREDWEAARQVCRGVLVSTRAGRWDLPLSAGESRALVGLVIVTGVICREVRLRDRCLLELLGPGDVLQLPVVTVGAPLSPPVRLTAALDTEMIALGQAFIGAAARWPSLLIALQQRLEAQRERLAVQAVITHLPKAEHRLLLMLWHLADRWGIVTPAGTVLPLPLSHDILGQLVASRRTTATLALAALERAEQIKRLQDRSWLLTATAEHAVEALCETPDVGRSLGEILAIRLEAAKAAEQTRALRAEASQTRAPREQHHLRSGRGAGRALAHDQ